tara:strand:+ start:8127 stop:8705 length:579 start_codon:yes stop_codon:yes gene_type:complete
MVMTIEETIETEIRQWSKDFLEVVNPEFNNMPACPFAAKSWSEERVGFSYKNSSSYQGLTTIVSTWDDKYDLVVLVDLDYTKNHDSYYAFLDGMNEAIAQGVFIEKDIWLMAFHPDDEPNPLFNNEKTKEVNLDYDLNLDYAMVFVQRLSKLCESAKKLEKAGYYAEYEKQHGLGEMLEVRENYYRRLKNGT